jgi:hypothetical protein
MTIDLDDAGAQAPRQRGPVCEEPAMSSVELELRAAFPSVPTDQVAILVECLWAHFDEAPVRDIVPLLVLKQAKEELREHLDRQRGADDVGRRAARHSGHGRGVVVVRPPTIGRDRTLPGVTQEPADGPG